MSVRQEVDDTDKFSPEIISYISQVYHVGDSVSECKLDWFQVIIWWSTVYMDYSFRCVNIVGIYETIRSVTQGRRYEDDIIEYWTENGKSITQ